MAKPKQSSQKKLSGSSASPSDEIVSWLQKLPETGREGFEGLVAALLQELTGYPLYLAQAGTQFGRDAGTRGSVPSIAMEAKRYSRTSRLNARELHGELEQAQQRSPQLELWILAATRAVSNQLEEELRKNAEKQGIWLEVLDIPVGSSVPDLVHLSASLPELLEPFRGKSKDPFPDQAFVEIRSLGRHAEACARLRGRLQPSAWGFVPARDAIAARFRRSLESETKAKLDFGQKLAPLASGVSYIPRSVAMTRLSRWWSHELPSSMAALVGEEGCGKSWMAATWVEQISRQKDAPLVIWCSSSKMNLSALRASFQGWIVELVVERAIEERLGGTEESWRRRVLRWLQEANYRPRFLLVLDGLNEIADVLKWRACLEKSLVEILDYGLPIAVLCTARVAFWQKCRPFIGPERLEEIELTNFSDDELNLALNAAGRLDLLDQPGAYKILRKPRYFGVALRHLEVMQSGADLTLGRLLFEDFRERCRDKEGFPLRAIEFNRVLMQLAARAREVVSDSDLMANFFGKAELLPALEELESSGILEQAPANPGHYRINPDRSECLSLGLGLHLLKKVVEFQASSDLALEEFLDGELEPGAEMDQKAEICAYALMVGFLERENHAVSDTVLLAFLRALVRHQNGVKSWQRMYPWLYFSERPEVFRLLTEEIWESRNSRGVDRLEYFFAELVDLRPISQTLIQLFERWMGWVSLRRVQELGFHEITLDQPYFTVAGETLQAVKGSTWITRLVLQTIAAGGYECKPFLGVFRRWAAASAAAGGAPDITTVKWLFRFSKQDLGQEVRDWCLSVFASADDRDREACDWILQAEGSEASWQLLDHLSSERSRKTPALEEINEEMKSSERLSPGDFAWRIGGEALDPNFEVASDGASLLRQGRLEFDLPDVGQTCAGDIDLERVEPVFAALAPEVLSEFWLRTISDAVARYQSFPNRLPIWLEDCFLLLTPDLLGRVSSLQQHIDGQEEMEIPTERGLAAVLLATKPSLQEQIDFLVGRRNSSDDPQWVHFFGEGSLSTTREIITALSAAEGVGYCRLWWVLANQSLEGVDLDEELLFRDRPRVEGESEPNCVALLLENAKSPDLLKAAWRRKKIDLQELVYFFDYCDWARAALLEFNEASAFDDLALKSWLIKINGMQSTAIMEFATDLGKHWETPSKGGRAFHSPRPCIDVICSALMMKPSLAKTLCDAVRRPWALWAEHDLLAGCVKALMKAGESERALEMFKAITRPDAFTIRLTDACTGISAWSLLPFVAGICDGAIEVANHLLARAKTDWDLAEIVFGAERYGWYDWLSLQVDSGLGSERAVEQAKAWTVWGLCANPERLSCDPSRFLPPERGWLKSVAWTAQKRRREYEWARVWFERFALEPTAVKSWGAFRCFLRCVDVRFYLSCQSLLEQAAPSRDRQFLLSRARFNERLRKRKKDLAEVLFGLEIPGRDLPPWKEAYTL